ncbi:AbrB/MazE/SpoVT family DNA-binding domain-containing protein [candidate division KSB1 bacterium]|nr:AbrB/MazE/SpoVT family DNA-binding domain-containing protein [candidate division KSB1 bacterium]
MLATIDKFGRIVIPKKLRAHLGITTDSTVDINKIGKRLVIEPVHEKNAVVEKNGFLIYVGRINIDFDQAIKSEREKRITKLLLPQENT